MKKIFFYLLMISIVINSCKKTVTAPMPNLPWHFTLNDSSLNKTYTVVAGTYEQPVNSFIYYNFSTFDGFGNASKNNFSLASSFRYYQTTPTNMHFDLSLFSLDTVLSQRLLFLNPLQVKQNALKDIFMPGKTYQVFNQAVPFAGVMCIYTTESNQVFATNVFNPVCKGSFTVTSANVWDDGTGKAKIKVSLNYNFTLLALDTSTSQWLTETKAVSGSLQTFFAIP